jgi:hypothetical protein
MARKTFLRERHCESDMAKLGAYFGTHAGSLEMYVGIFQVGSGTFKTFNDAEVDFAGSYQAFGQSGTFTIRIRLTDANPAATSGPCEITLNAKSDAAAKYAVDGTKLTITTKLNQTPVAIYGSQGGTQVDGISGHNLWIGQWGAA